MGVNPAASFLDKHTHVTAISGRGFFVLMCSIFKHIVAAQAFANNLPYAWLYIPMYI